MRQPTRTHCGQFWEPHSITDIMVLDKGTKETSVLRPGVRAALADHLHACQVCGRTWLSGLHHSMCLFSGTCCLEWMDKAWSAAQRADPGGLLLIPTPFLWRSRSSEQVSTGLPQSPHIHPATSSSPPHHAERSRPAQHVDTLLGMS